MQVGTLPYWLEGGEMRTGNYRIASRREMIEIAAASGGIFSPANEAARFGSSRQGEVVVVAEGGHMGRRLAVPRQEAGA